MPPPRSGRPDLALLITVLIWGLNFPIIKVALGPMPPFVVNALRFSVSAAVLGALYAVKARGRAGGFWEPMRAHGRTIIGLGLLGYVTYQLLFIVGVDMTSAGSASLIVSSSPVWTAVIARLLGVEHLPVVRAVQQALVARGLGRPRALARGDGARRARRGRVRRAHRGHPPR